MSNISRAWNVFSVDAQSDVSNELFDKYLEDWKEMNLCLAESIRGAANALWHNESLEADETNYIRDLVLGIAIHADMLDQSLRATDDLLQELVKRKLEVEIDE